MHNGPATSTDSPLCLNLISFEVVQGETWAERKSPIPMKKKKIKKEHIYTRWQKVRRGLPSNSADCLCSLRSAFWISMKAKPVMPSSSTWQVGYHFPRLKVAICFHWKWVTGSHYRDAAVCQGPVLAWQEQGSCGTMGTDEGQRWLMPLLSMELALAILELPGSRTGGLETPTHPCEGRESCVPAPTQCCVVRAEALQIFGGIELCRHIQPSQVLPERVLVSCHHFFGLGHFKAHCTHLYCLCQCCAWSCAAAWTVSVPGNVVPWSKLC